MKTNEDSAAVVDAVLLASTVIARRCQIIDAGTHLGWSESKTYKVSCTISYKRARLSQLREMSDRNIQLSLDREHQAIETLSRLLDSSDHQIACNAAKGILSHNSRTMATLDRQSAQLRHDELIDRMKDDTSLLEALVGCLPE